jgi:hypothetical protein
MCSQTNNLPPSLNTIFGTLESFRLVENSISSGVESSSEDFVIFEEKNDTLKWFNDKYEYKHNGKYNFTFYSKKKLVKDFIISLKFTKIAFNHNISIGFSMEQVKAKNYVLGSSKNEWCIKGDGTVIENNFTENHFFKDKLFFKSGDILHLMRRNNTLEFEIDGKENNYSYQFPSELYFLVTLCSEDDEVELLHN